MKYFALILIIIGFPSLCFAQLTINETILHDDIQRDYILYIPANYTGTSSVPLVLNYHGYGSSANDQMWYGDFRSIADSAGFIIAHPQGTLFENVTHWNVGGWTIGSTVDDVGFSEAMIDSISAEYNIDANRIYSAGMSNGGFMSFLLACQLSYRIAAIASVTGSMTPETLSEANPLHPTPVMQFHGTADGVVPYSGASWTEPIEEIVDFWVDYNNCSTTPSVTEIPDISPLDGSTVEHYVYNSGDNGVATEHFKIIDGAHTWPGSDFGGTGTNYDINASEEIWTFFSRYDINGLIDPTDTEDDYKTGIINHELQNHPNPFNPSTTIQFTADYAESIKVIIYNIKGQQVRHYASDVNPELTEGSVIWNGTDETGNPVSSGIYFYKLVINNIVENTKKMTMIK